MARRHKVEGVSRARVADVVLDPEFQQLVPLGPNESQELVSSAFLDTATEPLIVWEWKEQLILLVGYDLFPALRKHAVTTYPVAIKRLANRGEARRYIVQYHMRRGVLSKIALSYFRAQHCQREKGKRGGDRRSESYQATFGGRKTVDAMAELYHVNRQTLFRDMDLAEAIDKLTHQCGTEVKLTLLMRETKWTRQAILDWAELTPERQQQVWKEYQAIKRVPPSLRAGSKRTITLPRKPKLLVRALAKMLGRKRSVLVGRLLLKMGRRRSAVKRNESSVN